MSKQRPIIASQAREDVRKVGDLVEVAGSRPELARWCVAGVAFEWSKGARFVTVREGLSTRRVELDEPSKTAAKRAVFAEVREC